MNALLEKLSADTALDRVLDKRETSAFVGVSIPTLDRMVRRGDFPKPLHLSARKLGWQVKTAQAWLKERDELATATANAA
jgi:predicted DNA-binding transcriptional regulator AlpA